MSRRIGAIAACLALVVSALCAMPAAGQTEFRGFWADAFHAGFKSTTEINSMVARAVQGNYNAIVAEVLAYKDTTGSGHGAYWNSSIVPKATDISGGIDPLAYLVQQAHANGIEVHAWLVAYRVSTSWPPSGNATLTAHPEWIAVAQGDMGGGPSPLPDGKYVLDPGSPEVQAYLVSIVQELVTNYDIDGINWDYIRYTYTNAGYPSDAGYALSSLARFQQITGYVGTPSPTGVTAWNDFRRRTIDELIRRCRAEIPAISAGAIQTADLICSGDAPTLFTSSEAYLLHQNWRLWMEKGWLDAGMPMNYKRDYLSGQYAWYRNWVDAAVGWKYDRHMYCGQANYLNTKADSIDQLDYVFSAGAEGAMNYSYHSTADEDMNGIEENDWTWYPYVASNLFTSPASIPVMPWHVPATATEGTLWGRITDYTTGLAIDDATVAVAGADTVQTDGNGYYVVTLAPAVQTGTLYDVDVTGGGYATESYSGIAIYAGGLTRYDVVLGGPPPGLCDMDSDGDVDLNDLPAFRFCLHGPGVSVATGICEPADTDGDLDVDAADFAYFQRVFTAASGS